MLCQTKAILTSVKKQVLCRLIRFSHMSLEVQTECRYWDFTAVSSWLVFSPLVGTVIAAGDIFGMSVTIIRYIMLLNG